MAPVNQHFMQCHFSQPACITHDVPRVLIQDFVASADLRVSFTRYTCSYHHIPWLVLDKKHGVLYLVGLLLIQVHEHADRLWTTR